MRQLQQEILRYVARGEESSKSTISKDLHKNYPDVSDSVKRLVRDGYLLQKGDRQGRGHREKFYILTDVGIEKLIDLKIPIEDFWNMLFFIFDKNTNQESKFPIDRIFSEYQRSVLLLPPKNAPFFFEEILDNIENYETQMPDFKTAMKIIELLGHSGSQTITQIFKKLELNNSDQGIYSLVRRGLVVKINSKKEVRYRLSHPGLLLLLDKIWDPIRLNRICAQGIIYKVVTDSDGKKWRIIKTKYKEGVELHELKNKINLLVKNYRYLLPKIFDNWQKLRTIMDEITLINIFRRLYFPSKTFEITFGSVTLKALLLPSHKETSRPIQIGGGREIFDIQRSMEVVYRERMRDMFEAGVRVLESWLKQNGISDSLDPYKILRNLNEVTSNEIIGIRKQNIKNSEGGKTSKIEEPIENMLVNRIPQIIQKLNELDEISTYRLTYEHYDSLDLEPNSYRIKTTEKALENIITFQFYTFFGPLLKSEDGFLFLDSIKLREWYLEWMEQIIEFNKNNLVTIKKVKAVLTV